MAIRDPDNAAVGAGGLRGLWRERGDQILAWAFSGVLHGTILLAALLLAWPDSPAAPTGDAKARDVGIVHFADAPAIAPGPAGAVGPESPSPGLAMPAMSPMTASPVAGLGDPSRPASPAEKVIGVDLAAGASNPSPAGGDWASLAAGGSGQGGGGVSFFGLEAHGTKFIFVVDHSGSMHGEKLAAAKAELLRSVASLDRNASFYTIFFNDDVDPLPGRSLLKATETAKRSHFDWVSRVSSSGGTYPAAAVKMALALHPDAIWLLSDGIFDASAVAEIRQANPGKKVRIHTIAFYSREGEKLLRKIAEENRGAYRFVSPAVLGLGRP